MTASCDGDEEHCPVRVHFTLINRLAAVKVISMLVAACFVERLVCIRATANRLNWAEKIDTGKFNLFVT